MISKCITIYPYFVVLIVGWEMTESNGCIAGMAPFCTTSASSYIELDGVKFVELRTGAYRGNCLM